MFDGVLRFMTTLVRRTFSEYSADLSQETSSMDIILPSTAFAPKAIVNFSLEDIVPRFSLAPRIDERQRVMTPPSLAIRSGQRHVIQFQPFCITNVLLSITRLSSRYYMCIMWICCYATTK